MFGISGIFWKTFSLKYTKVYIIRKTILLGFHCFLFHENILFASEVIGLLFSVDFWSSYYFQSIFASFSPDTQWRVTFSTALLLLVLILWKKNIKQSSLATFSKKIEGNTKKRPKWPNFKDIWNIKAKFEENKFKKYIKV